MDVYGDVLYIPCSGDNNVWYYDGVAVGISGDVGVNPVYAYTYGGNIYVTCNGDDTVWYYNGVAWTKSGDVGNRPRGMAEYGGDLYVACEGDDTVWVLSGGAWALDANVGDTPQYLAEYGGDLYLSCAGADDDVWVLSGGAWAKDDDVDGDPQEFHEHDGDLYLTCETDDTVWILSGGAWAVATNIMTTLGNAPIGIEEYDSNLYVACQNSVWANISDFWNENSDFSEVTLDEPMFLKEYGDSLYCSCSSGDSIWVYSGETLYDHIHCWIDTAQVNATDAFRIEIAIQHFNAGVDVVPATSDSFVVETLTGVAAQYQSYEIYIPVDMTGVIPDASKVARVRRIASSDEIAGEVVIEHVGIIFKCDKFGSATP
jgi:hypothetical protein